MLEVLDREELQINLKKLVYFIFVTLWKGLSVGFEKVKALLHWLVLCGVHGVKSFHGIAIF